MLQFFRKYQKIFFVVVTVFIVISFSFFGTFSTMVPERQVPDKVIGKAIDGSNLSLREVDALTRFLSTSREDRNLIYSGKMPNLLNDNVIHRDFLITGMGVMLAEKYFDVLQADLEGRLKKLKAYRPYVHPQAPFINAKDAWKRFSPAINEHLSYLQRMDKPSPEGFSLLCSLYAEQSHFPSDILSRILSYQQKQFSWIQEDPRITPEHLSLFGYQTMDDWFGQSFLELSSQFIINASLIAKEKGYKVSNEEVKAELLQNAADSLQAFAQKEEAPTAQEINAFYHNQLQSLGMDEKTAVNAWKKVVLFRRLFNDVGSGVLLNPMLHEQFLSYAKESVSGDLYQLPDPLKITDFRSLLKLQVYLDGVSKHRDSILALPKYTLSAEEVEKKMPQLVQRRYVLEFAEVKKEEIEQQISLKETWDWELEEGNWNILQKEFPSLAEGKGKTRSERFELLEKMSAEDRQKADMLARGKILEEHPDWIADALKQVEYKKEEVHIRSKDGKIPFSGVKDPTVLLALLHAAPLKGEENPSQEALAAKEKLSKFSADGTAYYSIRVCERTYTKEVASFKEANQDGTLDQVLDKRLEEAYPEVRKKDAFFKTETGFKPFKEVKDMAGYYVFADLTRAIEQSVALDKEAAGKEKKPLDFYVANRFVDHLRKAKEALQHNPEDPNWIKGDKSDSSLASQWLLVKTHKEIKRCASAPFAKDELFILKEGDWSSVAASSRGDAGFFHLLKKEAAHEAGHEKILHGQQLLGLDAKRDYMRKLVQEISQKKAISLSHSTKDF